MQTITGGEDLDEIKELRGRHKRKNLSLITHTHANQSFMETMPKQMRKEFEQEEKVRKFIKPIYASTQKNAKF